MRIALTQSEGRLEGLQERLEAMGLEVLRFPLVQTQTLPADLAPLDDCRWWLFTSVAAVRAVLELRGSLPGRALGAVGRATQQALEEAGGRVDLVAPEETAESLAEAFLALRPFGFVGLPQGNRARPVLAQRLREAGYVVRSVVVYQTQTLPWPSDGPVPELVLLTSPTGVEALPEAVGRKVHLLALGPTTAAALSERGFPHTVVPRPSVEAVLETVRYIRGELCSI
ncbi:uroporphyrinogen-III synthase [Meiothermus ruber]|jgi:uroporphyrinogen-III synthase|uniref:Uroporphyrinogen-III synthase n=1 Tax=Meiothermus ruber (strain ATCC 35948 / DSM 1279 / VKM B-1258 / 21) TaxID=504728 RepID=D3PRS8_MEIRD|nr:uroporphyrinogen-III synthase [Meiothermus ruber]ADD28161.1 Uroporphyrinogen III synthase HEM4 [Meiothermus ruber DSM 1279]AGK04631.1 uroporphyrinogen III synthase HEM4 [Meiothermus ruber DSM 1279]MCL6528871.1 uroporphyrinogen-III synthase [Meiothermus ruber]